MANKVLVSYDGVNVHIAQLGRGDTLRLVPGTNVVDAATWARFAPDGKGGSPAIKSMLRVGQIKVVRQVSVPEPAADEDSGAGDPAAVNLLAGLKTKDAVAIVRDTFDVDLLRSWQDSVSDRKVAAAIATQLDQINGKADAAGGAGGAE
jgi:hypothetical protein